MRVGIIGAGASGVFAALILKQNYIDTTVIERNANALKKIYATGNGRCNFTNRNVSYKNYHGENPKFTISAIKKFDNYDVIEFFNDMGIPEVELENGKIFPKSLQASSIVKQMMCLANHLEVEFIFDSFVDDVRKNGDVFEVKSNDSIYKFDYLVVACGSKAYKKSGSDGNGYILMKKFGHNIVKTHPGIVQLRLNGDSFKKMSGTKFKANAKLVVDGKEVFEFYHDVLFTDYGISGPTILQLSGEAIRAKNKGLDVKIRIDTVDLDENKLYEHLIYIISLNYYKKINELLVGLINDNLIEEVLNQANIEYDINVCELSKEEIYKLAHTLKNLEFSVSGYKDEDSGQITCGGVDTDEINPSTMESKKIKNLYIIGEIMDVDGDCGGYNLQWAFSSAYSCAMSIIKKEN
ncbi:MAG: NAD(P)/FAD-dependent oxidoreductase [Finegoldia magna]|uniref:NAD(P)/FAD-dependent oxidoreductase n=1 Tax=Finegoldia TaxID=150022 RepID=UPI0023A99ECA|nr:NAD(P)/FAD-dependent oxidoreductase [Finegoldia magna]MCC2717785.1 NAD(P)/FAD-dependent oxidoreductase [Finegoldia magna]MDU3117837.1 NAD(P)/FAD-dependent oxidoreductase [Finegoldia magna]MDU3124730.1 NAD(P)/FAD-dependent oxidoreductase [Finegoldia magna]MDU5223433.1 NAD(P)/FAD-dependent oxidoreductase [Finegoldia magna]MDU7479001.1 NAD(P)/FAD-dependent oxidoreductase [Finegoldia magna]